MKRLQQNEDLNCRGGFMEVLLGFFDDLSVILISSCWLPMIVAQDYVECLSCN